MKRDFNVYWSINVMAESPEDAAREALAIQRDRTSDATVFDVHEADGDHYGAAITVDLNDI